MGRKLYFFANSNNWSGVCKGQRALGSRQQAAGSGSRISNMLFHISNATSPITIYCPLPTACCLLTHFGW
jgi:hypothetical protein